MTQSQSGSPQVPDQTSQLSAMFDDALPAAECELLARRVSADQALQQQWDRYAVMGAALRGDPICARPGAASVAARVQAALASEPATAAASEERQSAPRQRWTRPLLASGIAAGVAALSLLWLQRTPEATGDTMPVMAASGAAGALPAAPVEVVAPAPAFAAVGQSAADAEVVLAPAAAGEPDSYVVPALPASPGRPMSSAQLANFVVAHSEFSGSLSRRGMLSALVAGDASVTPVEPRPAPDATVPVEAP
jgi:negative regulator of sigma E activity